MIKKRGNRWVVTSGKKTFGIYKTLGPAVRHQFNRTVYSLKKKRFIIGIGLLLAVLLVCYLQGALDGIKI